MSLKILKDKSGHAVEGLIVVVIMILVFLFGIQTINVMTTAQKVRQRTSYSLSLLEASITKDIYSSLTEKDFDYYAGLILDDTGTNLKSNYNRKFFELLQKNLPYNVLSGDYVGQTFTIKGSNVSLKVEPKKDENSIKLSVVMDVSYTANFPLVDKPVTFMTKRMVVTSDYHFFDIENSDKNSEYVHGNEKEYGDKTLK